MMSVTMRELRRANLAAMARNERIVVAPRPGWLVRLRALHQLMQTRWTA